jgi:hypothetical protein
VTSGVPTATVRGVRARGFFAVLERVRRQEGSWASVAVVRALVAAPA